MFESFRLSPKDSLVHWFTGHHKSTNSQFIFDHVSGVLADDFRLAEKPVIAMFVLTTQNVELMVSKNALCLPATQLALSQIDPVMFRLVKMP